MSDKKKKFTRRTLKDDNLTSTTHKGNVTNPSPTKNGLILKKDNEIIVRI